MMGMWVGPYTGSDATVAPEYDGPITATTLWLELIWVATDGATVGSPWSSAVINFTLNLRVLLAFQSATASFTPSDSLMPSPAVAPDRMPWKAIVYVGSFFAAAPAELATEAVMPEKAKAPAVTIAPILVILKFIYSPLRNQRSFAVGKKLAVPTHERRRTITEISPPYSS